MSVRWTRTSAGALLALAALAVPGSLLAQRTGSGGEMEEGPALRPPATEVGVTAGALTPLADLARTEEGGSLGLSTSFAASIGVTRWLGDRWGLAMDGLWATGGSDLTAAPGSPDPPDGGDQGGTAPGDAGATYLSGTARVLYRLSALSGVVEPQLGLGAGLRHLEMDATEGFGAVNETDPVAVLSGAVRSPISGTTALTVELRDLISFVDAGGEGGSDLQNDVIVLVGFSFRP